RGLHARFTPVEATCEQCLLCCSCRDGFSWNAFSLGDGRVEPGQILGGASVLRDRICTADGTGAISDGYRSPRPLEKSESARYRGAPALGFCGKSRRRARASVRDGALERARRARTAARGLGRGARRRSALRKDQERGERRERVGATA